ncbi:MAG: aconitase/3-isopropylmalate dehydratase large subunit family protein [Candidatus Binatia bacterium]
MGQTISEKILSGHAGQPVTAGDIVVASVDGAMGHDARTEATMALFNEAGLESRFPGNRLVFVLDHYSPPPSPQLADLHRRIRLFADRLGAVLYDVGEGICHNLMTERGHVAPGELIVGTDSHSITYGALNCFATGIESSELVALLATSRIWFRVPETIRVELEGRLRPGLTAKDLTLWLLEHIREDGAAYRAIEFQGGALASLKMDARFTLCNHAAELGAKVALMPYDDRTEAWLNGRVQRPLNPVVPDTDATYEKTMTCNLSSLEPRLALPSKIDRVALVKDAGGKTVDMAFIGSCTNGRFEDLQTAAEMLAGKKVAKNTRLLVNPGSRAVYLQALEAGIIKTIVKAGASVLQPGCGSCVGMNRQYVPANDEVILSTANRNLQGRLGNPKADIYVASPATVAASALTGRITDPREFLIGERR